MSTMPSTRHHQFLINLNSRYPSTHFTMEVGSCKVSLLDLSISIDHGIHEFDVFRKNKSTDSLIRGSSSCLMFHKYAAFNALPSAWLILPSARRTSRRSLTL